MIRSLLPFGVALLACAASARAQEAMILHADGVIGPDGAVIPDGKILLRGDRIFAVGADVPQPAGVKVVRLHGVLAPGMIDAAAGVAVQGEIAERAFRNNAGLRAADALDLRHRYWQAALERGITAVHVVPDPARALAGDSSVVRTGAAVDRMLAPRARAVVSLVASGFADPVIGPTAVAGALEDLDAAIARAPDVWRGRKVAVYLDSAEGARAATQRAREQGFDAVYLAWGDVGGYGRELAGALVVLPAIHDGDWSARLLETWKRLHGAGVRVAFGTRSGRGGEVLDGLRTTAMAYSRATGDPAAAMAAVTGNAAAIAGLDDRGRIAPGAVADLVLWSGHPLDGAARVQAVMLAGRTVWTAPVDEDE
ncbi:MAG TPA: amidohydrolase family protein [Planctomycetota bacterium]